MLNLIHAIKLVKNYIPPNIVHFKYTCSICLQFLQDKTEIPKFLILPIYWGLYHTFLRFLWICYRICIFVHVSDGLVFLNVMLFKHDSVFFSANNMKSKSATTFLTPVPDDSGL